MRRGFRPAGGKFAQTQIYTVRKNRTVFIHAAQRTGVWMALLLTATFRGKYATAIRKRKEESIYEKKFIYRNGKDS